MTGRDGDSGELVARLQAENAALRAQLSEARPHEAAESYLRAVGRVMARITANVDRQGVLEAVADGLVADLGIDLACIWLYDPADDALHLRARAGATGLVPDFDYRWTLQDSHVPIIRAIQNGRPGAPYDFAPKATMPSPRS